MKKGNSLLRNAIGFSLFGLISFAGMAFGAKDPGNVKSPEMVNAVTSGKQTTANAAWWGFDAVDATDALQSAINSGAKKLIIPNMGRDWIVRPIQLAGDQEVFFEKGAVVTAKKGEFRGVTDMLLRANGKSNIVLRGYGAIVRMQKQDYMLPPYSKGEWRHAVAFYSCTNIQILGLTVRDSGGDGIYLGADKSVQLYNKNVLIKDVVCDNNYRQGISVISAEDLTIENCSFQNTWGTAPAAGIDLEPNFEEERLVRCVIRKCTFQNNEGAGVWLWLGSQTNTSADVSITFENCRITGEKGGGIFMGGPIRNGVGGLIEFRKCKIENTGQYGLNLFSRSADNARVRFIDCTWKNVAIITGPGSSPSPFIITLSKRAVCERQGGAEWVNCRLEDNHNRPFLTATMDTTGLGVYALKGTIKVIGPGSGRMDLGTKSGEIDLKVK